jgi:hypothetical protein
MNDELVCEILQRVVVQIKVAQHLLPLCECIGNRTLFPTRVSERAESARGLERNLQVLRVAKVVFRVILVWVIGSPASAMGSTGTSPSDVV